MKRIGFAALLITSLLLSQSAFAASPKAGASCSKINQTQTYKSTTYKCIKSGKKLVWDKGTPVAKPAAKPSLEPTASPTAIQIPVVEKVDYSKTFSTDDGFITKFASPCDYDRELDPSLTPVQDYFYQFTRCAGQLRLGKYSLGSRRSGVPVSPSSDFSNTDLCKIVTPPNVMSNLGFTTAEKSRNEWANTRRYPSPSTVIQLVPVYASDTSEPKNSPETDYKIMLDYYKNWIAYSSDFGSNVEVRIPTSYIKMPNPLGSYSIFHTNNHDHPEHVRLNKDVVAATDPVIDYTGANIAIIVAPRGTPAKVLPQSALNSLLTAEGKVGFAFSQYAYLASSPGGSEYSNLGHPFWWIHESFHAGYGFDDHYGDTKRDINSEYGMGWLTMMTPWGGDLTTWEKWIMGFMQDSQIQCLSKVTETIHWIAPSTVKTKESKAVVIPVSATKVVVVESKRPGGLDYKFPLQSQGVLVYEVDLLKNSHGMGMKLSLPIGRIPKSTPDIFMVDYPLKTGEVTISNGIRIEVVDSGTFGDVVKVSKA